MFKGRKNKYIVMTEDEANGNVQAENCQPSSNVASSSLPYDNSATLVKASPTRNSSSSDSSTSDQKKKDFESKKLNRGISRATDNVNLVSQARSEIIVDVSAEEQPTLDPPLHTFALPDLTKFPDNFRRFLEKDLIALSTQISLEQANRLNWWTAYCQRLWPLSTSGDGNCLLHAASLGMWGFHDRLLTLRKALHGYLTQSPRREALWRRWRRQQNILNCQAGLVYSEVEWRQEWNAIVNMASSEPRLRRLSVQSENCENSTVIYESLEEIHVLALAHVLRRPIIVVADTVLKDMNGEALAPIPFGGIYLPLECSVTDCHRSPLLLAFDGGHFSALVAMDSATSNLSSAVPITDSYGELLPLQFSVDPGPDGGLTDAGDLSYSQSLDLLNSYLDIIQIGPSAPPSSDEKNGLLGSIGKSVGQKLGLKLSRSNSQRQAKSLLCCVLHSDNRHEYYDVMIKNYLDTARERFEQDSKEEFSVTAEGAPRYDTGKSQFYTEVDSATLEKVSQLPSLKLPQANNDTTLYLSNSTFYQPSLPCRGLECTFFGNPQNENYCSKCYRELLNNECD